MADSIVNRVVITRKNLKQSNLKIFDPAYKHYVHSLNCYLLQDAHILLTVIRRRPFTTLR